MTNRKGLLLRVGIDQKHGGYNAPINPKTNDYIYLPIPQDTNDFISGMETTYATILPYFEAWCKKNDAKIKFIDESKLVGCHLDPDFDCLTYGDQAIGRGLRVGKLNRGDFIVFFASFKPISECNHNLVYALYGIMFVEKVVNVAQIKDVKEFNKNAHTRVKRMNPDHWVVIADPYLSGRFNNALPIGEFRNGAYRVKKEILDKWGDIDVNDGFIQRSVCPPWFKNPEKFLEWFKLQQVTLINSNWK